MHDNFIAMDKEKRDRIINAAMREFAARGFKNASTNEIVKNAHISKGALFHYFASKKDLFAFLLRYSIDLFMETAEPRIQNMPTDVFERWMAFAALKIEIASQYPDMAGFMQTIYDDDYHEVIALMQEELSRFSAEITRKIYDGIDLSKFKPEVDVNKALQIIWWVMEGFALAKQKERHKQLAAAAGEIKTAGVKPADKKATDTEPNDTKSDDTKPNDAKPDDTKPTDTKPTDANNMAQFTKTLINSLASEMQGYLDMLKKAFYREGA